MPSFASLAVVGTLAFLTPLALRLLRLPDAAAQIAVGVVVGPQLPGWGRVDEPVRVLSVLGLALLLLVAGLEIDVRALVGNGAALVRVPLFVLALLVVHGVPALLLARAAGHRRARAAVGLLQATSLSLPVVAGGIGVALGLMTPTTYAAPVAAGLGRSSRSPSSPSRCCTGSTPRRGRQPQSDDSRRPAWSSASLGSDPFPSRRSPPMAVPTSMMALRAHSRGGPEVLVYERAPVPVPAADEVLVAVHAASITFTELTWDETWLRDGVDRTPVVPAHELAGRVVATGGPDVDLAVGDEVYGLVRFDRDGAAAEYVAVPAADLAAAPTSTSAVRTAALPLAGLTAWQALHDLAGVRPGEDVLVHGGVGGVGGFAVQLAAAAGAHVTSTARAADRALVERLGARTVVDFEHEAFDAAGRAYDVVVDTVGGDTLDRSFGVLRPGGRLVTLQAPPDQERATEVGVTAVFFIVTPDRAQLDRLAELVDSGRLEVLVAAEYPLAAGREAFASVAGPHDVPGKTVLVVDGA